MVYCDVSLLNITWGLSSLEKHIFVKKKYFPLQVSGPLMVYVPLVVYFQEKSSCVGKLYPSDYLIGFIYCICIAYHQKGHLPRTFHDFGSSNRNSTDTYGKIKLKMEVLIKYLENHRK